MDLLSKSFSDFIVKLASVPRLGVVNSSNTLAKPCSILHKRLPLTMQAASELFIREDKVIDQATPLALQRFYRRF